MNASQKRWPSVARVPGLRLSPISSQSGANGSQWAPPLARSISAGQGADSLAPYAENEGLPSMDSNSSISTLISRPLARRPAARTNTMLQRMKRGTRPTHTARTFSFVPLGVAPNQSARARLIHTAFPNRDVAPSGSARSNQSRDFRRASRRLPTVTNRAGAYSLADQSFASRYSRTIGAAVGANSERKISLHRHAPSLGKHSRLEFTESGQLDADGGIGAERLNLYIDRQQDARLSADARILDPMDQEAAVNVTFRDPEPKTMRERWKQNFRIALPHVGLVFLSAAYTLLGAAIFHQFETPYEMHIRNKTSQRVQALKDQIIQRLWTLAAHSAANSTAPIDAFWDAANNGMNSVIKDVFIDYTRHYMTPDDIIYGTGPTKWSFGSSVFFSWTAITTIGYGHIVPLTLEGRISCLLYALFGIPLILVTIADMGRFLSGGIIWVHNTFRKLRKGAATKKCRWLCRLLCCQMCAYWRKRKAAANPTHKSPLKSAMTLTSNNAIAADAPLPLTEANGSAQRGDGGGGGAKPLLNQLVASVKKRRRKQKRTPNSQKPLFKRGGEQKLQIDAISDAGTFEDISEIRTQEDGNEKTTASSSDDTRARADELQDGEDDTDESEDDDDDDDDDDDEDEVDENGNEKSETDEDEDDEFDGLHSERRVSVLFILVVMLGYTAGGACLMQLWERWKFVDAFYFCFVTVTTIGFGDIVPQNVDFLPATLAYIVVGLIITTMCIDLVGSEYIRDIHFYGRSLGRSFLTIGGKVVHLGEVFSYVAFLQKSYGLTPDQLDRLAQLPEEYLLDCLINGRQPDLNWIGGRPFIPPDIYYFKWIEQPRTLSFTSERVLASVDSELDLNTSLCSTARTLTPREYYQKILVHYCKQMQQQHQQLTAEQNGAPGGGAHLDRAPSSAPNASKPPRVPRIATTAASGATFSAMNTARTTGRGSATSNVLRTTAMATNEAALLAVATAATPRHNHLTAAR